MEKRQEFREIELQQEIFLKQKSKISWLTEGDRNSKYFHALVKERKKINSFMPLMENPSFQNSLDCLRKKGLDFFKKLLSFENCLIHRDLLHVIPNVVEVEDNLALCLVLMMMKLRRSFFP